MGKKTIQIGAETAYREERVELGAGTLVDDFGHTLDDELRAAFDSVGRHLDELAELRGEGTLPDKPYKIVVTLELEPVSDRSFEVGWGVAVKYPDTAKRFTQQAYRKDGAFTVRRPGGQGSMGFGTSQENEEGEEAAAHGEE